jgi:hypothetical protein
MSAAVVMSRAVVIGCLIVMLGPPAAQAAIDLPPLLPQVAPVQISKPGQLALSQAGDRVAVTDRFANRIFVLDTRGQLIWSAGEGISLNQPTGVTFSGPGDLLFSQWDSQDIFHISEKTPNHVDTVADLTLILGPKARILRLSKLRSGAYLVLADKPELLVKFDSVWSHPMTLVKGGSGRGKLNSAASSVELAAGRIGVAGGGTYPVQVFDGVGRLLFAADWNNATPQRGWEASALTVDQREMIWVADVTHSQFRRYDLSGTLVDTRDFANLTVRPVDMVITSDNQLVVANDNGRVEIYDLSQE